MHLWDKGQAQCLFSPEVCAVVCAFCSQTNLKPGPSSKILGAKMAATIKQHEEMILLSCWSGCGLAFMSTDHSTDQQQGHGFGLGLLPSSGLLVEGLPKHRP